MAQTKLAIRRLERLGQAPDRAGLAAKGGGQRGCERGGRGLVKVTIRGINLQNDGVIIDRADPWRVGIQGDGKVNGMGGVRDEARLPGGLRGGSQVDRIGHGFEVLGRDQIVVLAQGVTKGADRVLVLRRVVQRDTSVTGPGRQRFGRRERRVETKGVAGTGALETMQQQRLIGGQETNGAAGGRLSWGRGGGGTGSGVGVGAGAGGGAGGRGGGGRAGRGELGGGEEIGAALGGGGAASGVARAWATARLRGQGGEVVGVVVGLD